MTDPVSSIKPRATYADLEAVPDHQVAELIDGELYTTPRPGLRHARASSLLGVELGGPFDHGRGGPGGWILLDEPELHIADDVVVPDLAGWRRERFPHDVDHLVDPAFLTVAPDWICEVISPSTERLDRARKAGVYARAGVHYLWLLNPMSRTLEILRVEDRRWLLLETYSDQDRVRAEPFDVHEWDLATLWLR
jgi:Uma2 family endonuclease